MIVTSILVPLGLLIQTADSSAPRGQYVEARTASVFAGACHYGGERTTAGREALLVWRIESGAFAGVDLSGVRVAAAIADEGNLDDAPSARQAVVYFDDHASHDQRTAGLAWLAADLGQSLGHVAAVKTLALRVEFEGDAFSVEARSSSSALDPALFELSGALLPDRACCKMPLSVWYAPFQPLAQPIVGHDATFRYTDRDLGRTWSRPGENAAFSGRFGVRAAEVSAR